MKKILSALIALYLLVPASYGQDDEIRPKAVGFSFFLNDFISASRIRTSSLNQVLSSKRMAKFGQMDPGMAFNYFKGISKHADVAMSLGGTFCQYPFPNKSFNSNRFLLEGTAAVNLKMTTEKYWVQPYISLGVGAHKYGKYYGAFMPLGLGMKVNFWDDFHLFVLSTYRVPVTTETANYHLQHSLGIAARVGKKKEPVKVVPLPPLPPKDTDGDGIIDSLDKCPTVKGLARYNGCPIPDTDKDGINDEEDKCPTVPGVARYQGCPIPDTDGDGVNDEEDRCPTIPGVKENYGCPIIPDTIRRKVEVAAKNILFVTGSAKLAPSSFKGLNEVARIMNQNPGMKLNIAGHTDWVGNDAYNQKLSDNRAASVMNYLISKGVEASRMKSKGYGETTPIADNKTAAGRTKNRRVELMLSYIETELK